MMINGPWQFPALDADKSLQLRRRAQIPAPQGRRDRSSRRSAARRGPCRRPGTRTSRPRPRRSSQCLNSDENQLQPGQATRHRPDQDRAARVSSSSDNPHDRGFADQIPTARARTGELGADWPKAATKIYTAVQAALTGQASAARRAAAGAEWLSAPRRVRRRAVRSPRATRGRPPGRGDRPRPGRTRPPRGPQVRAQALEACSGSSSCCSCCRPWSTWSLFFGYPVVKNFADGLPGLHDRAPSSPARRPGWAWPTTAPSCTSTVFSKADGQHGAVHRRLHRRPVRRSGWGWRCSSGAASRSAACCGRCSCCRG